MYNAFTHELGHAFANNKIIGKDRDETKDWVDIYNQINAKEDRANFFRDYAMTSPDGFFADSCDDYYHNPNNLKMVEIDIGGYDNLYDYMNEQLLPVKEELLPILEEKFEDIIRNISSIQTTEEL